MTVTLVVVAAVAAKTAVTTMVKVMVLNEKCDGVDVDTGINCRSLMQNKKKKLYHVSLGF